MAGVTTRNAAPTRRRPLAVRNANYGSNQKEVERQRRSILAAVATRNKENLPNKDGTITNKDALIAAANGGSVLQEDSSDDEEEEEQISMNNDQAQAQEGTTVEGSGNLLEQATNSERDGADVTSADDSNNEQGGLRTQPSSGFAQPTNMAVNNMEEDDVGVNILTGPEMQRALQNMNNGPSEYDGDDFDPNERHFPAGGLVSKLLDAQNGGGQFVGETALMMGVFVG